MALKLQFQTALGPFPCSSLHFLSNLLTLYPNRLNAHLMLILQQYEENSLVKYLMNNHIINE